jgi:hypothetical protein
MRAVGTDSVFIVEGGGKGRLSRIKVSADAGRVTALKGVSRRPVSVTVLGTTAYVLEGQLWALFDPPDQNRKLNPFHATPVEVGNP